MQETNGFPVSDAAPALAVRLQSAGPVGGAEAYGLGVGRTLAVAPDRPRADRHRERREGRAPRPPALRGCWRVNAGGRDAIRAAGAGGMVAAELAASDPGRSRHPLTASDGPATRDPSADGATGGGAAH